MRNKNFVPKEIFEKVLYNDDVHYSDMRNMLQSVFDKKSFLEFKYVSIVDMLDKEHYQMPQHGVENYSTRQMFKVAKVNGIRIPAGRVDIYLLSIYLTELLGIKKQPIGNENYETLKNGVYLLLLEFDITSLLKLQSIYIKLNTSVLTGRGPLVFKKMKNIKRNIKGGCTIG